MNATEKLITQLEALISALVDEANAGVRSLSYEIALSKSSVQVGIFVPDFYSPDFHSIRVYFKRLEGKEDVDLQDAIDNANSHIYFSLAYQLIEEGYLSLEKAEEIYQSILV